MPVTRKYLKSIGLNDDQIEGVIEEHTATLEAVKKELEAAKADALKLESVQKELDELKNGEDYKAKYEAEKAAHDKTKSDYEAKENAAKVKEAYRAMLKEAGVAEKYLGTVLKATDLSAVKLDKDGKIEGADKLIESAKTEWADFISVTKTEGAKVDTPPKNNGGKMTKAQISEIKDPGERRAAIAANPELFNNM